jgi:hypothetical protein
LATKELTVASRQHTPPTVLSSVSLIEDKTEGRQSVTIVVIEAESHVMLNNFTDHDLHYAF